MVEARLKKAKENPRSKGDTENEKRISNCNQGALAAAGPF